MSKKIWLTRACKHLTPNNRAEPCRSMLSSGGCGLTSCERWFPVATVPSSSSGARAACRGGHQATHATESAHPCLAFIQGYHCPDITALVAAASDAVMYYIISSNISVTLPQGAVYGSWKPGPPALPVPYCRTIHHLSLQTHGMTVGTEPPHVRARRCDLHGRQEFLQPPTDAK